MASTDPAPVAVPVRSSRVSASTPTATEGRGPNPLDPWAARLPWAWLAGSTLWLSMLGAGLVGVERLGKSARPLGDDAAVARRCRDLARALGIARRVGVAASGRIAAPVLLGIVRPMILLPPAAFDVWTWEQVEMALLHELAHLRRWDNHVNLFQRVAEALLFFHPVAWWLSGWVRLERELCCDRLVVERTGRPCAYARMLASLAGSAREGSRGRRAVLGMADRQVTTRIRRILDMEDRSMKLTLSEGCGLLALAVVATTLALAGAHAAPPSAPESTADEPIREALRKAVLDVNALPLDPNSPGARGLALAEIASAQWKLGDRDAALATIRQAPREVGPIDRNNGGLERLAGEFHLAEALREMGDPAGARAALDRLSGWVDAIKIDPTKPTKATGDGPGRMVVQGESLTMMKGELLAGLGDEWIKLGDRAKAQDAARRGIAMIRDAAPKEEPAGLMALFVGGFANLLARAGDPAAAREIIAEARRKADAITDPAARGQALCYLAQSMGEMGDVEAAIALARLLRESHYEVTALSLIVEGLAEDDPEDRGAWFDPGGIKILIGAVGPNNKPKDADACRIALPRLAEAVATTTGKPPVRARLLSAIAHLQAKAGDLPGAVRTAGLIPDVKRGDYPGPSDGFHDSVKPGTLALLARARFVADNNGDPTGPDALSREATELTHAIADEGEAIVARLVIARGLAGCGRADGARALLAEAVPLALKQPEPRRSRSLAMISEGQARAGDLAAATATAGPIRDYPTAEKHRALTTLADVCERAGDREAARRHLREALRVVEAKAPEKPAMGKVSPRTAFSQATYLDLDLEIHPSIVAFTGQSVAVTLLARLGDVEGARRRALALPAPGRDGALSTLAGQLANQGEVRKALEVAAAIEQPQQRLGAIDATARAVPGRTARR